MATGGSVQEVSIKGRIFAVRADADVTRKLGGWEVEVLPNGNGTASKSKKRVTWSIGGLTLDIDDERDDQQFLQEVADSSGWVPITVTFASGITYMGTGTVSGELSATSEQSVSDVTLSGPGRLEPE